MGGFMCESMGEFMSTLRSGFMGKLTHEYVG